MTLHLRAHFDGKVIVPEEPLDIPVDQPLSVRVDLAEPASDDRASRLAALQRIAARAVEGVDLPAESLSRESIYED
jgi:hypothetical protein